MKLSDAGELSLLEILRKQFIEEKDGLLIGIGDDCAVIKPRGTNFLLTTDMMVEGVHFDFRWMKPLQLGFKLVSVNVSDIYAMGGTPRFLLLNFAASGDTDISMFREFFRGIRKALGTYRMSLIGGDISSSDKVMVSATVTGHAERVLARRGARVGDRIYVSGTLGDSACGLQILKKIRRHAERGTWGKAGCPIPWRTVAPLVKRHLTPVAVKPDRFVRDATAMIDVSDGLLIDLRRMCKESGVGADIHTEHIPLSRELRTAAGMLGLNPLDLALGGGEDYELLFTSPAGAADAHCIGEITRSSIRIIDSSGKTRKAPVKGYQHFD